MSHTFFNSRLAHYKTPFGAVPAGTAVTLRLDVPQDYGYVDPHLVLTKDREDFSESPDLRNLQEI